MIPGEGGRGADMRGGATSCPTARRCPEGALGTAHNPNLLRPKFPSLVSLFTMKQFMEVDNKVILLSNDWI
jgi:hypothetical protein